MTSDLPGFALGVSTTRSLIEQHGFWFVDVPRTSSTSIRTELARRLGPPFGKSNVLEQEHVTEQFVPDHLTARQLVDTLGRSLWDEIFTFSIVRNPWDRTLSMYFYRRRKQNIPDHWSFDEYVEHLADPSFRDRYFAYPGHRAAASDFLTSLDGQIMVDHIVRFENRAADLRIVAERCGIPDLGEVDTQRASPIGTSYTSHYSHRTREIVGEMYRRDVELFGYEFGDPIR